MENVKDPADRTVTIEHQGRAIARGELYHLEVETAPCIICQGESNCCLEFEGSHPGKIFTCDICSRVILAADVAVHMPWRPVITRLKVTMDGEDMGEVGVDAVPPGAP